MTQENGDYVKWYKNEFENCGDSNIDIAEPTQRAGDTAIHDIWVYNNVFHIDQNIAIRSQTRSASIRPTRSRA